MKSIFYCLVLISFLWSCKSDVPNAFEFAGGSVSMCLENEPKTYFSRDVDDYYTSTVLSQVVEGLVAIDPSNLKIVPQLAAEWKVSDDKLSYTFTIREGVKFHPHELFKNAEDRNFSSEDVKASIELACTKGSKGEMSVAYETIYKHKLKGAQEFHEGKSKSISGLKIDGKTIKMELLEPSDNFLYQLAGINGAIVSQKVVKEGKEHELVGTGPFIYKEFVAGSPSKIRLVKNDEYYLRDENNCQLPYLDSLSFIFENKKLDQLEYFENHQTDLILGLPTSRITMMLEGRLKDFNSKPPKLVLYKNPLMITNYYQFNMLDERFKDPRVRQAFNYAVNREKIGREILRNQYEELGYYGMIPPIEQVFKGYNFDRVQNVSYNYNPIKAKKLLADAGYPNGEGFGSVELKFNIGDINSAVADEFAQQIHQVLGINVNIDGSTFEQLVEDLVNGNGSIFRSAWSADYPNPENFLNMFYSKWIPEDPTSPSRVNESRYRNPLFDAFFEKARTSKKLSDQMENFSLAEKELMLDPPIIPLWYSGDIQIVYSDVRNLNFNALNRFDFKKVYKKEWTEEEYNLHSKDN